MNKATFNFQDFKVMIPGFIISLISLLINSNQCNIHVEFETYPNFEYLNYFKYLFRD